MGMKIGKKEYQLGDYPKIKKDLRIELSDLEKKIITSLTNENIQFDTEDDFKDSLKYLVDNWPRQRLFYGKVNFADWKNDNTDATKIAPTLCSGRPLQDAIKLHLWAKANSIQVNVIGTDHFTDTKEETTNAPFKGHLGDKVQTLKYLKQKQSSGSDVCLVMMLLNKDGVRALKKFDVNKIADGNEGYVDGGFGLKNESQSVSVAISDNSKTWDFLAPLIAEITLSS